MGIGETGKRYYKQVKDIKEVVGFLDNDSKTWGVFDGVPILGNRSVLAHIDYDEIVIASMTGLNIIKSELLTAGVQESKIVVSPELNTIVQARINFLRDFAKLHKKESDYAVAEGGVFQGEFSKEINKYFPNARCYLFDTFTGFDKRDLASESVNKLSDAKDGYFSTTNEKLVWEKILNKDKVEIRKGYFPESAYGLEKEKFVFVNLDFDLYTPTLEGIKLFYPKLIRKGILLIHDFFNPAYSGVKKAVEDYEKQENIELLKLPIGDACSIAVMKINC